MRKNENTENRTSMEGLLPYALLLLQTFLYIMFLIVGSHDPVYCCCNFVLYMPVAALLVFLPISWNAVYILNSIILISINTINEFLLSVRGRPLNYLDLFCIKDGLRVASGYKLQFSTKMIFNIVLVIVVTVIVCLLNHSSCKKTARGKKALIGSVILVISLMLVFIYHNSVFRNDSTEKKLTWDETGYVNDFGIIYAVYSEYVNSKPREPEGYSPEKAQSILDRYNAQDSTDASGAPDAVYVIMNEALTDYSLIGETDLNDDPLKKIHALKDNCFKGRCAVNPFGGDTCNTEFEFLTGFSLAFIPNTHPYVQFSMNDISSFVSDMSGKGFTSTAVHPYWGMEWRRSEVYDQLGFSEFISGELFSDKFVSGDNTGLFEDINNGVFAPFGDDLEYIRIFISDAECYRKVLDKASNKKDFVFAVTVQNHSDYMLDFEDEDMVSYCKDDKNSKAEQYLNLVRISDGAFDDFINTLRKSDRKSVVLMFGDHQPNITFDQYKSRFSDGGNPYQEMSDKYIVPYIMWASYDIDWEAPELLSINYLSSVLKKNCDLPLSQFDQLRLDAMAEYPVITSHFAVDKNGDYCSPYDACEEQIIKDYSILQYAALFDKHNG